MNKYIIGTNQMSRRYEVLDFDNTQCKKTVEDAYFLFKNTTAFVVQTAHAYINNMATCAGDDDELNVKLTFENGTTVQNHQMKGVEFKAWVKKLEPNERFSCRIGKLLDLQFPASPI